MINRKTLLGLIVSTIFLSSCSDRISSEARTPDGIFYFYKTPEFDQGKYVSSITVFAARHGMSMSRDDSPSKKELTALVLVNEDVRLRLVEPFKNGEVFVSLFDVVVGSGASKKYQSELFGIISELPGVTVSYTRAKID